MRLALAFLLLAPLAAAAQPTPPPTPRLGQETPARAEYVLAVQLLNNGRVAEATPLLEDLLRAEPTSVPVRLKLKEAYETARRYPEAVALMEAWIEQVGPNPPLVSDYGVALYRAGQPQDATRAWREAIALAPDKEQTYRTVANAIGGIRLYTEAADVLDQGRLALGDDNLFLLERAHLYGLGLEYGPAIDLYLQLLATQPEHAPGVRARLTRLLEGQDAPAIFAAAVDRAITLDPLNRAFRELAAWLALERKDYGGALDAIRALDRLESEQGQTLLAFAEQAAAADATEAAGLALDEILARHPDAPSAPPARLMRAQLWDDQARADRESADRGPTPAADAARDGYRAFLDANAGSPASPRAAFALATLLRDVYRDYDASEVLLEQAASGRSADVAARARLALGEVAVRRGDLDGARDRFTDVETRLRIGTLAEQARYEMALVDFYEGFMFSALARVEAQDENTAADAANDAIALRVTLTETLDQNNPPGPDDDLSGDPLHVYARAALLHRRGLPEAALAVLDTLDATTSPSHPLADESLYLRASILRASDQAEAVIAVLDRLAEQHPMSFFLDRALRLQAQVLEDRLGDPAGAAERYTRLLERFPGSLFAPEARLELRRLRSPS
ncbi:MAG: tetratricopeptide repeat protein [Bacteroidota bacterium]